MLHRTPDEIRALASAVLTRMAWEMGLAPEGLQLHDDASLQYHSLTTWAPHENVAQAAAILRTLEARGWTTHRHWDAQTQTGEVHVYRMVGVDYHNGFVETWQTPAAEARALLLCAVLAAASEREEP